MGGKTKQTTTRTPYNPAAVDSANKALGGAYGQAQGTIAQELAAALLLRGLTDLLLPAGVFVYSRCLVKV